MDFSRIKHAVTRQFDKMTKHDMFCTEVPKDVLWLNYLQSFPAGTNPIFRERTDHDCSCCRQFIRTVGNVVAIIDGKLESIWDIKVDVAAYQAVADSMSQLVKAFAIQHPFLHYERNIGTDKNFEAEGEVESKVITWHHFFVTLPHGHNQKDYFCAKADIPTKQGEARAVHDVLLRSLNELTMDAIDTVLELIAQNSLYRGNEHKFAVDAFRKLKKEYKKLARRLSLASGFLQLDVFVWSKVESTPASVSKIRNTSIGTLLIDLSEGVDLEDAVRKFEAMVAPANYKRPTALVTKAMVESAKKKIEELGLASALERRYATLADISVNDIIFADRKVRKVMKDDVFDSITTKKTIPKNLDKVASVTIDKFIEDIVPNVDSIEVMLENEHVNNLVNLIAPVDRKAGLLFKWDNNFSWSYNGDVADSIKERVKKAGGNVTGDLCCRLAWFNFDDLDFHMQEAGGHIWYGNKYSHHTGGRLDVDMNAGSGSTREPVENIYYDSRNKMREGVYTLSVHQFRKRESDNVGFEVEIDYLGEVTRYAYEKAVRQSEHIQVAKFKYSHAGGMEMIESLPSAFVSKKLWNLTTQDFHPVNVLLRSPNHWGGHGVGNKHYFFMLKGCVNDGQARGFFNEFLKSDLDKHRKVFEIVGSKMKTEQSVDQLSGLGFSDTKRSEILVRVKGNFTRTLRILF